MRKGYVTKIIALSFIICHLLFSPARAQFTSQNPQKNQAVLTLKDGSRKYYDTETVESIDVEGADITIHQQSGSYTYKDNVTSLAFNKGNTENKVVITEAKGWLESAYVKFTKLAGISKYNVYVNGKTIDTQLVRDYGTYGRADAVGLAAGTYSVKVVPVGDDGKEFADCAGEATDISVRAINRDGYAHYNTSDGIGAYNNDGTLKTGARVLYVTKNNAKTV